MSTIPQKAPLLLCIAHFQTNSQVEVTSENLIHRLCTRLGMLGGSWVDELDSVLWSYWVTPRTAIGETLFSVYGIEVVILVEIGLHTCEITNYDEDTYDQRCGEDLDLIEEKRLNQ